MKFLNLKIFVFLASFTLVFGGSLQAVYEFPKPLVRSQLSGYSMHPTIKSGQYILYRGVDKEQVEVGDIVVFKDQFTGTKVCHRVVEITSSGMKTKGDNNRFRDRGLVSDYNLIGLVTHIDGKSVS